MFPLKAQYRIGYRFREKTSYSQYHLGLDCICPTGTAVYAPFDGRVTTMVGTEGGNTVWFYYQNYIMRGMHLSRFAKTGDVKQGDIIGYVGSTGSLSSGPHLHWDISLNKVEINNINNFVDPETFVWDTQEDFMTDQKLHDLVRNIVYTGYVLELGRVPESDQVIEDHVSWIMRDSGDSYNFKGAMEWLVNLHSSDEAVLYRKKIQDEAIVKAVEQTQSDYQKEKDRMAKQLADQISACKKEADDRTIGDVRQDSLLYRIIGYISNRISGRTK